MYVIYMYFYECMNIWEYINIHMCIYIHLWDWSSIKEIFSHDPNNDVYIISETRFIKTVKKWQQIYTYICIHEYSNIGRYVYIVIKFHWYKIQWINTTYIYIYKYIYVKVMWPIQQNQDLPVIRIYIYKYVWIFTDEYIHIDIYVYINIYTYTYVHIHTYAYIYIHIYNHTYT
jgi:hypothetical protein